MIKNTERQKTETGKTSLSEREEQVTTFGKGTRFAGVLRFKKTLCIQGAFQGTIKGEGSLVIDKDAHVEVNELSVSSLIVRGFLKGRIFAVDKVDMLPGATVIGDVTTGRLRIADNVSFEGQCIMTGIDEQHLEIFSRPTEDIKAELKKYVPHQEG
ncbi:polymer-forming cytoskeletal protein [Treponema sp. J25]|uniref:bactofilin family protein n=1 Tax=Treponema sp. J25 TaxID=2094121 RepID=UPI001047B5B3|nr:polymer-forming cytoskeletal protein [Treponema sp. J25]TCW62522.1 hypothetical protein C5O22_00240 [Treponema sp. J25]